MNVEIRSADSAVISGYVNAVERESRILHRVGAPPFREIVKQGTFAKALKNNYPIKLKLNHERVLCDTSSGLELREDNIGLFAKAVVSDKETIKAAQEKKLTGWSFGFRCKKDSWSENGEVRTLEDIELDEVSILTKTPAYTATSIEMRDGDVLQEIRHYGGITVENSVKNAENPEFEIRKRQLEILRLRGKKL